jgi:hypothetical protein
MTLIPLQLFVTMYFEFAILINGRIRKSALSISEAPDKRDTRSSTTTTNDLTDIHSAEKKEVDTE